MKCHRNDDWNDRCVDYQVNRVAKPTRHLIRHKWYWDSFDTSNFLIYVAKTDYFTRNYVAKTDYSI